MSARLLLLIGLAVSVSAAAETSSFVRYLGGGDARSDCMLVTDVAGASGAHAARCTDGDPACDADGAVNGSCLFRLRVCLDATEATLPRCGADVVTGAVANVSAVETVLQALSMPVDHPSCTADALVSVPRRGARGRAVLRASATMASGHRDRDRVPLVCRRPAAPATFATIQKKIFAVSGATVSCHGAADSGGLTLTPDAAYANLVGVAATNPAAHAAGLLRVAPGDPDHSFLLDKITGRLTPDEGKRMPLDPETGAPAEPNPVTQDFIEKILIPWIRAGAKND